MYVPPAFEVSDRETIQRFLETYDFATLISACEEGLEVSHLPLLLQCTSEGWGTLVGHMAKANPHAAWLDGRTPALAIFHGPHAFVSPAWYAKGPAVPTWNYATVHVHGTPRVVRGDDPVADHLGALIERHDAARAQRWLPGLPEEFSRAMRGAITAFEFAIDRVEAKFKLGQNRSPADRAGMLAGLEEDGGAAGNALVAFAREWEGRKNR